MNIKVSMLSSVLHQSNEFSKENLEFLNSISNVLGSKINISEISDYDCNLKLIFIASGGSEGLFLENIKNIKPPYYLLTKGNNNSLAASLEILTYINNKGLDGEVLHGDINYIAKRIKELINKKHEDKDLVNLGVIGTPSDWLISSIPNYEEIKNKFKINLINISLDELIKPFLEGKYLVNKENEEDKANRVYLILKDIVNKYNLKGFTIRCFDLLGTIYTTGCLALAKFNEEGIIGTCEGDIMAMISMYLIKSKFNVSSFQANPSVIDSYSNQIIFAHCTCPLDMISSYKYMTHFESKIGIAIKGELYEKDITIFRLSSNLKDYYLEEGKILTNLNEENLCRTQIKVQINSNVNVILQKPCGNHHIIFYGKNKEEFIKYLKEFGY